MNQPTDLAGLSDGLVTSAIAVLALAFVVYAVASAMTHRQVVATPAIAGGRGSGPSVTVAPPSGDALSEDPVRGLLLNRVGGALTVLGVALTCVAVVLRGAAAGRAPWGNMYEFGITGSAAVGVVFLALLRTRPVRDMAVWVVALVLVLLGVSITTLYTPVDDLVPVLDSRWLVVHVAAAILGGALFTVGAVATAVHLVQQRRSSAPSDSFARLAHSVHLVAFPIWTFAVIAGAIWAENAWGRYWGWDPKETWAFITWVLYAAHLHALSTAGWRRGAGVLAIAGYLAFLFNFFGVNIWIPGLHSYAGV